jgi:PIN domain nuclease of toxin-antitoxin system
MKLLVDTHILLWWLDDPSLLSDQARLEIADGRNLVFVSAASVWEIAIKRALGKLECPTSIVDAIKDARFAHLPVALEHADAVGTLPPLHRDPFDRLLVAQCACEEMTLVTRDRALADYAIPVLAA